MVRAWSALSKRRTPRLARAHRFGQSFLFLQHEFDARKLVRPPPIVGQARRRQAPLVTNFRIQIDRLIDIGQVLRLRDDCSISRKIFCEKVAICGAPARNSRWWIQAHSSADWAA